MELENSVFIAKLSNFVYNPLVEEAVTLNIIYLPDEKTRKKAVELSERVASQLPTEFVLGKDKHPHITIYQARFPTKNLEKLKEEVRKIASKIKYFEVQMKGFSVILKTFFWWNCIKTESLAKIHLETLEKINPLREGLVPLSLQTFKGSEEDENEIKNYGSLLIGKRYGPHITITRLKNPEDAQKAIQILGKPEAKFRAKSIALGYLGDHGAVTEIIESFPLLF